MARDVAWLSWVLVVAAGACGGRGVSAPEAGARAVLVIEHVTLIDPASGAQPDMTIVIEGGRIAVVGPAAVTVAPAGAVVHDARGQFALPGLWDSHVHVSQIGLEAGALLVANGVVGVRDMGSAFEDIARWRRARAAGRAMPRVFSPGPKLDGDGDAVGDNWVVKSPAEARDAVDRLHAMGVDFIKVHNGLSRPVYEAIADQCRKDGLWFAGHATGEFGPMVAVAARQRTIEHGRGMLACTPSEHAQIGSDARLARFCAPPDVADQILPAMARSGVWFTPTLVSWRGQRLRRAEAAQLDGVRYAPPGLEHRWRDQTDDEPLGALELQLVTDMGPLAARAARAGVALLAGSDAGDPYVVPGFALHDELQLLVEAGVPPLQAIRSATLEPARALGVETWTGSIEHGKVADIVLVSADPLTDIRHTRRIVAVVLDGRWLGPQQLAALLPHRG